MKERLGSQWAHITSQPEVEEAINQVQVLYTYFERIERMIQRQLEAMQKVNDVETEVGLYYQQEGYCDSYLASSSRLEKFEMICYSLAHRIRVYATKGLQFINQESR